MIAINSLPGSVDLEKWFGYIPNFHDAEVIGLDLNRSPDASIMRIHAWHTSKDVDDDGCFHRSRHAIVSFIMSDVAHLEIREWNHQNVLACLDITECAEGYTIVLDGTFGVDGKIVARGLSVAIEPKP